MTRYKDPQQQQAYDELLAAASNPDSHLFIKWTEGDGTVRMFQRVGASHRSEFWRGVNTDRSLAAPGSIGAVYYRAGVEVRKRGIEPACSAGRIDPTTGRELKVKSADSSGRR